MEHDKSTIEGVIRERVRLHDWYLRRGLDRPLFTEHSDEDIERVASAFRSSGVATPLCFWMNESPSPSWVYTFRNKSPGEGFIFLKMNYILCDEFMMNPDEREIAKAILSHIPNPSDADKALVDELAFVVRKRRIRGPQLVKP